MDTIFHTRPGLKSLKKKPIDISQLLEDRVKLQGQKIFSLMEGNQKSLFSKDWWYGRIMEWSMKNEQFKTQMFRFVDVLPYLNTGSEVAKHLKEYFSEGNNELPSVFNVGMGVGALAPGLMAGAIKKNVTEMAKMFITGESPKEALPKLRSARKESKCFTVDLLGEATLSEKEALEYQKRYIQLINDLVVDAQNWSHNPIIDEDEKGEIPKVNISVKVTSLYSQIKEEAWEESIAKIKERIRPIFYLAKDRNVFINIDMEQYSHKDLTLEIFKDLLMEEDFRSYPHFGIVLQAYLRESFKDTESLIEFAKKRETPFTVRLVKGAYWDYEVIHASQMDWPIPVYTNKKESDKNYEDCAQIILKNFPFIRLAVGSHNVRSISACLVMAEEYNIPKSAIEVQMLYGMADPIKNAIIKSGYRLREYATVGELIPGMAYLVRRLLENTSNESFLKSKFADNLDSDLLLVNPSDNLTPSPSQENQDPKKFYNVPLTDFSKKESRRKMKEALLQVKNDFGKSYSIIINNQTYTSQQWIERYNPSQTTQLIAKVAAATTEHAEIAIKTAKDSYKNWKKTPVQRRSELLENLASLIENERFQLAALQVYEVGKTWHEADGDVCEAVDFCRYYAKEMLKLDGGHRVGHAKGEVNNYHYVSRGPTLVIAPWNFPLAILTGMVAGALATGNTVVMKPAEQSSVTASQLMRLIQLAGFPSGVVSFLPGYGNVVGEYLVNHKDVTTIAFTGSQEVGLHIVNKSSQVQDGQIYSKRCIIEMGGKNAILVDSDADLDEAVAGILHSAYGFQGQKCSACSRVVVLEENYDRFVERFQEALKSIKILPTEDPQAFLGPVVDIDAFNKINGIIERGKTYAKLLYQGPAPQGGHFIAPAVFCEVPTDSELAQVEIFGPVLSIIKAKNFEQAIDIVNNTPFALTGGIFSRSPANIDYAKENIEVGNLYINRGITGALVNRQPFGGFKMSGLGSKTGGPDYLKQFMDPRLITENTMRRGFAPQD
ncbi:MAG: bifunctional proline dehydrogenase/L-glutamate gamma-semialdehyde dehydrogenase [Bdellovibrionaceae bacterium]|nr:bifunctional proline dehydrogenase/L-glutamate gamma-semialdehyde dehydrogenase [Pseudobdellovibrionaceae bacterium]